MSCIKTTMRLLLVLAFWAAPAPGSCQEFRNLDFEQLCDSSRTGFCAWQVSWGGAAAGTRGGNHFLRLRGRQEQSVNFVEQEQVIPAGKGMMILRVRASISSDSVEGRGAGINVGIYDTKNTLIATRDMGGFYSLQWIKGSRPWKTYTIEMICPEGAYKIKAGAILYGKGTAMFDNYELSMIPVTGRKPSKVALRYITAAVDTIALHSLVRDSVDMAELKRKALQIAAMPKEGAIVILP